VFCPKCGAELPDDAVFCMKCGTNIAAEKKAATTAQESVVAPAAAKALDCPSCGAPITPKFGEMIITCEYCGSAISMVSAGWKSVQKQTMLPLKFAAKEQVVARLHDLMDQGILHRHLQESSTLEEMNLSYVPYWIVSVSARTSIVASDVAVEAGKIATTAALFGLMGAAIGGGGRRGFYGGPLVAGTMLGAGMGSAMGASRGARKSFDLAANYNFPVVALKALIETQPRDYQFNLEDRAFFDMAAVPKGVKILNGDVGEESAKYQAKSLVDQLQSEKAHQQYHMIQQMHTDIDVSDTELLHAPIWFARYDWKGRRIALVVDANSGVVISSVGLEK